VTSPAPAPETSAGAPAPEAPRKSLPPRVLADGSQLPAVRGLLSAADAALAKGDVELAAVNLERAQRLAPQSAQVYQRLAGVRLRQKRPAEAEQLARKALGYASGPAQQAGLWLVIANARQMRGMQVEAQEARARAAALQQAVTAP
jgi:tetratricopeptide (TPR) repeat protein